MFYNTVENFSKYNTKTLDKPLLLLKKFFKYTSTSNDKNFNMQLTNLCSGKNNTAGYYNQRMTACKRHQF